MWRGLVLLIMLIEFGSDGWLTATTLKFFMHGAAFVVGWVIPVTYGAAPATAVVSYDLLHVEV